MTPVPAERKQQLDDTGSCDSSGLKSNRAAPTLPNVGTAAPPRSVRLRFSNPSKAQQASVNNANQPPSRYAVALYSYETDEIDELSFRKGTRMQVLTESDRGWWDCVIGDSRGWVPSNCCKFLEENEAEDTDREHTDIEDTKSRDENGEVGSVFDVLLEDRDQETRHDLENEASFWTPCTTLDKKLFYINTLTGKSSKELPRWFLFRSEATGQSLRGEVCNDGEC